MATFLGYSNFNGKNGDKFSADLLYDILEKNIAENYYKIRLYGYIRSWGYSGSGSYATFYINGKSAGGFSSITANQYSEVARRDITVNGDDEGNCVLDWSLSVDTAWTLGDASASGSLTLDKIPRKSSVSCANGNIESAVTINITRKSSSFTHTLRYDFGSLTNKTIVSKTTKTSYSWTLPTTFYAQIPNATSGKVTLYCDTYSGSDLIGTSSTTFTAKTTESKCKPSVSATIVDTNQLSIDLTGNSNNLVKNVSNALVTTTATPKNRASISSIKVECADGKSGTGSSITLKKVTSGDFTITIKDSRGYTNSTTISKTLVNYVPLTLNYDFYRPEPTTGEVVMNVSGKYFNGSFGKVGNHLTVQYRYKESGGTHNEYKVVTVNVTTSNTYSLELSLGKNFDYQKSYDFEIVAYDKIREGNPITETAHVSEGIPMLGLFKDSIETFGTELLNNRSGSLKMNLNLIYPIGSMIITTTNTNPKNTLGGEWELINKQMSDYKIDETDSNSLFTPVSSVVSSYTVNIMRTETSLRIRLYIVLAGTLNDNGTILGNFDFTKLGIRNLYHTMEQLPIMFDGGNSVVNATLGYTGELKSNDVISRGTESSTLVSGNGGYLNVDISIPYTHRNDNACDKFFWKRTS